MTQIEKMLNKLCSIGIDAYFAEDDSIGFEYEKNQHYIIFDDPNNKNFSHIYDGCRLSSESEELLHKVAAYLQYHSIIPLL